MNLFTDPEKGRAVSRALGLDLREVTPGGTGAAGPGTEELPTLVGTAELLPHLRAPHGGIHGGALLALADSAAGPANGLAVLPRWVVTTNLTMRTLRAAPSGPLTVTARVLRRGRHAAVAAFEVHDDEALDRGGGGADGRDYVRDDGPPAAPVALGRLTSAALDPKGGPPPLARPLHMSAPPDPSPVPWEDLIGIQRDPDAVRMPVTDDVLNPWGIVHGGATAALVDAAARHAAAGAGAGEAAFTADVALYYLAPGRVGPLRAATSVLALRPDGWVVDVQVNDEGAGDRTVASAVATVREA